MNYFQNNMFKLPAKRLTIQPSFELLIKTFALPQHYSSNQSTACNKWGIIIYNVDKKHRMECGVQTQAPDWNSQDK